MCTKNEKYISCEHIICTQKPKTQTINLPSELIHQPPLLSILLALLLLLLLWCFVVLLTPHCNQLPSCSCSHDGGGGDDHQLSLFDFAELAHPSSSCGIGWGGDDHHDDSVVVKPDLPDLPDEECHSLPQDTGGGGGCSHWGLGCGPVCTPLFPDLPDGVDGSTDHCGGGCTVVYKMSVFWRIMKIRELRVERRERERIDRRCVCEMKVVDMLVYTTKNTTIRYPAYIRLYILILFSLITTDVALSRISYPFYILERAPSKIRYNPFQTYPRQNIKRHCKARLPIRIYPMALRHQKPLKSPAV